MHAPVRSYFELGRFHSLAGAWLLLIPALWSLALNYNYQVSFKILMLYYLIFIVGSIFMRAFGCVINDMADMDFDAKVIRTSNRPLASKKLNKKQALWFLVPLGLIPLILLAFFNHFAQIIALCSLFLVILYPFTKRFIQAPQLILGLTFNWGIILADAVLNNHISLATWILYLAAIMWTLGYDTVYAYQDYHDDKKIGINSLAVLIGDKPQKVIVMLYILMLILLYVVFFLTNVTYVWYGIIFIIFLPLLYKSITLDYFKAAECFLFFKYNVVLGLLIWLILIFSHIN